MTTRKNFIGASALLAAAVPQIAAADSTAAPSVSPTQAPLPPLNFDLTAFQKMLDRDFAHKNLFAIRKIEGGSGLYAMRNTFDAYHALAVPATDIFMTAVMYHGASIAFAFDDHLWDTYIRTMLPKSANALKPTATQDDLQTIFHDGAKGNPMRSFIEALAKDCSVHFFVCNNALDGMTDTLSKNVGRTHIEVYNDVRAHALPNVTIVPAGVWAVHAIQERKFTLLHTT